MKSQKTSENNRNINSGLRPDEYEMIESQPKHKTLIMRSYGKLVAISAHKAGRQRLRQVTRWDTFDSDTANDFVRKNPGM